MTIMKRLIYTSFFVVLVFCKGIHVPIEKHPKVKLPYIPENFSKVIYNYDNSMYHNLYTTLTSVKVPLEDR